MVSLEAPLEDSLDTPPAAPPMIADVELEPLS